MEKRTTKRITVSLEARFFQGKMFHSGTVLNLSEQGMFRKINTCLLSDSKLTVFFLSGQKLLKVPVRINRISSINHSYNGIGVEIQNSPVDYIEFARNLSTRTVL